ncbi:hypothetical protein ABK040_008247 [Willaertia magna]
MNWIPAALRTPLVLTTAQSTSFFLGMMKVKPIQWLMFNACAPVNISFIIGMLAEYFLDNRILLHSSIPGFLFFGGMGLVMFPWKGMALIPQFSHIVMVSNALRELYKTYQQKDYEQGFLGLTLGCFLWIPFIYFQQRYFYTHPEEVNKILLNPELRLKEIEEEQKSK